MRRITEHLVGIMGRLGNGNERQGSSRKRIESRRRTRKVSREWKLIFDVLESRTLLCSTIAGKSLEDLTANGFSPDDLSLVGRTIKLFQDDGDGVFNSAVDMLTGSYTTIADGSYNFGPLSPATYFVQETQPDGWVRTAGPAFYSIAIPDGSTNSAGNDFGSFKLATLNGQVFRDDNRNGLKDTTEPGLASRTVTLTKQPTAVLLEADFSDGEGATTLDGFTASGLWHATTACEGGDSGHSTQGTAYFGFDGNCSLDPGTQVGDLASPSITLPPSSPVKLTFNYRLEGEVGSTFDLASLQISVDGGSFATIATNADGSLSESKTWTSAYLDLYGYAGHSVAFRFHFDSVDATLNTGLGWQVDDVKVLIGTENFSTTTNSTGTFSFSNLALGEYELSSTQPPGWISTGNVPISVSVSSSGQTLTHDLGGFELGRMRGQVFQDSDANASQGLGENSWTGLTISLVDSIGNLHGTTETKDIDLDGNGTIDPVTESGRFEFDSMSSGQYTLTASVPFGWSETLAPGTITIVGNSSGEVIDYVRLGYGPTRGVRGWLFEDVNGEGTDEFDTDLALVGWTVFLDQNGDGTYNAGELNTLSDEDGFYSFSNLAPGTYSVTVQILSGYVLTTPASYSFDLSAGGIQSGAIFGAFRLGEVAGLAFDDANGNGVQDPNDSGLQGKTLFLDSNTNGLFDTGEPSSVSGTDGSYLIGGVGPGEKLIRLLPEAGWDQTTPTMSSWLVSADGTFMPSLGTALSIGDTDDGVQRVPLSFAFPFTGSTYTEVTISANGFLWLGGEGEGGCCTEQKESLVRDLPRIAPFWTDLDPSRSGDIFINDLGNRTVITWQNVPSYESGSDANTFQVQLFSDGAIVFVYDSITRPHRFTMPVLVGVSPGEGRSLPGETSFGGPPFDTVGELTVYDFLEPGSCEEWTQSSVTFAPSIVAAPHRVTLTSGETVVGKDFGAKPNGGSSSSGQPPGNSAPVGGWKALNESTRSATGHCWCGATVRAPFSHRGPMGVLVMRRVTFRPCESLPAVTTSARRRMVRWSITTPSVGLPRPCNSMVDPPP